MRTPAQEQHRSPRRVTADDLDDELRALALATADELDPLPWTSEEDRWAELVFCVVNAYGDDDAPRARQVTAVLTGAGLGDPAGLRTLADETGGAHAAARCILVHHGFDSPTARALMAVLARLGEVVTAGFEGRIQRYLRAKAAEIRDELTRMIDDADPDPRTSQGVAFWLQNALNLPLSVEDRHLRAFCEDRGIGLVDLERAADRAGLNVAVVDDLVRAASSFGTDLEAFVAEHDAAAGA